MKAWVLHGINDLRLSDVPLPVAKDKEVIVKVKSVGICSSDVQRVYTTGAYYYPIILGHEFSGITSDGRRVGVFPLIPCHCCKSCEEGRYETCLNYSYIGSRQDGAFAEYVAVPEWNLIELPDNITFLQAALLEPAAVALHAVKHIDVQRMQTAAIVGNGAIGCLIARWLELFGIESIDIFGRNDESNGALYDICVEAAGTIDSFKRCIELTKPNGQLVLVGNPNISFNVDQKLYWQILRKQLLVRGSWNSSYPSDWQYVLEKTDLLQLDSFIGYNYKFDEASEAFHMMNNNRGKKGRIVVSLQ